MKWCDHSVFIGDERIKKVNLRVWGGQKRNFYGDKVLFVINLVVLTLEYIESRG